MADIKLLDCTLRDGGYVNDWQWGFGSARRIIQTLTERDLGVINISDDLPELLQNCDRILVMRKGHLANEFAAEGLSEEVLYEALASESGVENKR